jgi:type I restriction enzyme S subunit
MAWPIRGSGPGPYPTYKDSGLPWLGQVPEHWQVRRTKTILRERSQKGFPDETLLASTQTKGVVRKEDYENRTVLALKDLQLLKLVRVSDFVISLRSFQGGIEYARDQGIISPAYTILYPVKQEDHAYLAWLFKSASYIHNLTLYVTGIRQGQNIDYEKLSRSDLPLPPLSEQAAIVRYLDHADRKVRHAIRARQQLIKLLTEQKQAIIQRAVTCGLDPNVRLKPSGVPWLGDVPEHWEVPRLKQVCTRSALYGANVPASEYSADGIRFLRTTDIRDDGSLKPGGVHVSPESATGYVLDDGDLLISQSGTIGRSFVYNSACHGPCAYAGYLVRFVLGARVAPAYVMYYTKTPAFADFLKLMSIQSTIENVNAEKYANSVLPLPSLSEQSAIVYYLDSAMVDLDRAIDAAHREIDLLREYRTRLIADVVTGKLDVRGVKVPDDETDVLPEDVETIDDVDAADQGDDAVEADSSSEESA